MARRDGRLRVWFCVWVALIVIAKQRIDAHFEWRYPSVDTLAFTPEYPTDLSVLSMGAHRVAADIAFVQFLQYYGLSMHDPDAEEVDEHDPNHHHDYAGGPYPKLLEFGQRIARLDPYFNPAILDVAGALAFNQKRTAEALVLLEEAAVLDPSFYRYRLYMAAILYRDKGRDDKVAEVLAEAIQYPDCPLVLKNILANLYVKYGRFADAARVRLHIIETAPVEGDREFSRRKLAQILAKHPEIAAQLR